MLNTNAFGKDPWQGLNFEKEITVFGDKDYYLLTGADFEWSPLHASIIARGNNPLELEIELVEKRETYSKCHIFVLHYPTKKYVSISRKEEPLYLAIKEWSIEWCKLNGVNRPADEWGRLFCDTKPSAKPLLTIPYDDSYGSLFLLNPDGSYEPLMEDIIGDLDLYGSPEQVTIKGLSKPFLEYCKSRNLELGPVLSQQLIHIENAIDYYNYRMFF